MSELREEIVRTIGKRQLQKAKKSSSNRGPLIVFFIWLSLLLTVIIIAPRDPYSSSAVCLGLSIAGGILAWIGLIWWLSKVAGRHTPDSPYHQTQLLEMAKEFKNKAHISGADYGRFLTVVERSLERDYLGRSKKRRIIDALKNLIIEKDRRISGDDYVQLEKTLLKSGTVEINEGESVRKEKLFSESQIEQILTDYEKLREKVRDKRLEG